MSKYPGKIKRIRIQIQENVDGTRITLRKCVVRYRMQIWAKLNGSKSSQIGQNVSLLSFLFDLGCPIDSAESMLTAVRDSAESDCAMKGH